MYPYIEIEPVPDLLTDPASGVAPILQKQFEELGLPRTEAIRFGGVFRIRRPVLVTSRTDLDKRSIEGFAVVDEMVSEEGGYQVRVLWYKAAQRDTIRTSLRRYQ